MYHLCGIESDLGRIDTQFIGRFKGVLLLKMDIEEVGFLPGSSGNNYRELTKDTDTRIKYEKPHWVDANGDGDADDEGDQNYPVAYTRKTKPKIEAKFECGVDLSGQTIKIKATGSGGIAIPETDATVSGCTVTLMPEESSGEFVDTIKHYDHKTSGQEFELAWEMQIGSSGWFSVGETKHTVYLTFAAPSTSLISRQESLFKIACENSDGIGLSNQGAAEITQSIWSGFTGLDMQRVDGTLLKYYGDYTTAPDNFNTSGLLRAADGQCRGWVSLFIDARRVHGLDDASRHQILPKPSVAFPEQDSLGFLIDKWDFTAPDGYSQPYVNIANKPLIQPNSYDWKYSEVTNVSVGGLAGQNNTNPLALFDNHVVVKIGTEDTMDPSYGKTYSSLSEFADGVAAIYVQVRDDLEEVRVDESLNDDNGDGVIDSDDDIDDTVSDLNHWLFYTNPPGAAFHTVPE